MLLCENEDTPYFQFKQWTPRATDPRYRLETQVSERDTTSKMRLRIKPHPAVALILQHLRFEAHSFDVVGSAGEKETW